MKKYRYLALVFIALIYSISANAGNNVENNGVSAKKSDPVHQPKGSNLAAKPGISLMLECGRGYVVGVWSNANQWNQWAVWLSPDGRWSGGKAKIYWEYSQLSTDYDSGKNAYATILAAQASGQMVALYDDDYGSRCNTWGSDSYKGPQFNSVKIWFP
ncbi:hypothetical protein [Xenorhabdus innexi]|uniref:Uncharacterized protein n=1 Tax=Xenorhabdus innexi TaxID=290109 RepID=A0A1N6MTC7_9GAMM|nr:hypothetical protein [Xenorhabdus innexi]PHM33151.1 hypothetical protein Xinn_02752 [Xenorhabdus innexi]SIP72086.1 exported hypothetical protein [Xenorhabdus innexi]